MNPSKKYLQVRIHTNTNSQVEWLILVDLEESLQMPKFTTEYLTYNEWFSGGGVGKLDGGEVTERKPT